MSLVLLLLYRKILLQFNLICYGDASRDNRRAKRETGRDVIERSEYRETGRSRKALSEARDQGKRYSHEAPCETQLFHEAARSPGVTGMRVAIRETGCEVIDRSGYWETERSGKTGGEARDQGTGTRHEVCHAFSSKVQNHSPAISVHHKIINPQPHILKQSFREPRVRYARPPR